MLSKSDRDVIGNLYLPHLREATRLFPALYDLLSKKDNRSATFGDVDYTFTILDDPRPNDRSKRKILQYQDHAGGWQCLLFYVDSSSSYIKRIALHARHYYSEITDKEGYYLDQILKGLNGQKEPWTLSKLQTFVEKQGKGIKYLSEKYAWNYEFTNRYSLQQVLMASSSTDQRMYWDCRDKCYGGYIFSYTYQKYSDPNEPDEPAIEDPEEASYTQDTWLINAMQQAVEELSQNGTQERVT